MRTIDLHTHSTASDGTCRPRELVERAAALGLAAVALTDHDTTAGLAEALEAGEASGIEVIRGCEVSTNLEGRSVHMLAHGFPESSPTFETFLAGVREDRVERNALILERLEALGRPLTAEEVERHASGSIIARPHFVAAMIERGYVRNMREGYDKYLKDGGPAHVVVDRPDPAEAVRVINQAGGVATLAHPRQLRLPGLEDWRRLLERLKDAGMAGLEVYHPSHRAPDRDRFRGLAREFDLVATGGSDFHGAAKTHIEIGRGDGSIETGYDVWEALRERRVNPEAA